MYVPRACSLAKILNQLFCQCNVLKCFSSSSSTVSSQNQPSVSSQAQEAGSFQNQPSRKSRKRSIAALLADVTNQPESCRRSRVCKEETISKVATAMVRDCQPRGDASCERWKGEIKGPEKSKTGKSTRVHCTVYACGRPRENPPYCAGNDFLVKTTIANYNL